MPILNWWSSSSRTVWQGRRHDGPGGAGGCLRTDRMVGGDQVVRGGGVAGTRRSTASVNCLRGCSNIWMWFRRVSRLQRLHLIPPNSLPNTVNQACCISKNGWSGWRSVDWSLLSTSMFLPPSLLPPQPPPAPLGCVWQRPLFVVLLRHTQLHNHTFCCLFQWIKVVLFCLLYSRVWCAAVPPSGCSALLVWEWMKCGSEHSANASLAAIYLSSLLSWHYFSVSIILIIFVFVRNKDIVAYVCPNM